jgi:hypothetical protein
MDLYGAVDIVENYCTTLAFSQPCVELPANTPQHSRDSVAHQSLQFFSFIFFISNVMLR